MFRKHLFPQTSTVLTCLLSVCLLSQPIPVQAGCGCDKAPPVPTAVRPHATYAGTEVTLFHPDLQTGQGYDVTFTSGISGESASVSSQAVTRRDLADGVEKPQLVVSLPDLPLGPTSVSVSLTGQDGAILAADDSALTVAPQPISLPTQVGESAVLDFQAAVSRDGTIYVSLDLTNTTLPRTFKIQALGYPLRFSHDDIIFYNVQGFVMQLLAEGMPGLYAIDTASGVDSDILQYSRHEFNTYFLQHDERQAHGVDASDANWHADGTPHINHNHLIVAIAGMLDDGSLPVPGATPAFDLRLNTYSFFHHGLVGNESVAMSSTTRTASYNSQTGVSGTQGDVFSNGSLSLSDQAGIMGDATAAEFALFSDAYITGRQSVVDQPLEFLPVTPPTGLENLGKLQVGLDQTLRLVGPGSFQVTEIIVSSNGRLLIDNTAGPVTLYVTGRVDVSRTGAIAVTDPNPEAFAIYVASSRAVKLSGYGVFYGVIYAPTSTVSLSGDGEFIGAFVGKKILISDAARVHYDTALHGQAASSGSEPPSTGPSETTTSSTGGDSLTSTDATASADTTPPSNSPGNGKGRK